MDWDDKYDNMDDTSRREESITDKSTKCRFDPMDIADPASAYFFLSDDAQDEITGGDKKKMKCLSCRHMFKGKPQPAFSITNGESIPSITQAYFSFSSGTAHRRWLAHGRRNKNHCSTNGSSH